MSEFSEAYFLKTNDVQEAEQLLKNSDLEGYISEEAHNGWVVILPNKEDLLHYQYSEDSGFFFCFVQRKSRGKLL